MVAYFPPQISSALTPAGACLENENSGAVFKDRLTDPTRLDVLDYNPGRITKTFSYIARRVL